MTGSEIVTYLQLRYDDGVADRHLPAVPVVFGGEMVVVRIGP